jgi:alcohol dehydrogenase class IV
MAAGEWCHNQRVRRFRLPGISTEIALGPGASDLVGEELGRLSGRRALVLSTSRRRAEADRIAAELQGRSAFVLAIAEEHVPVGVAERARTEAAEGAADVLVAVGGGSTIGLAKAIALEQPVPIIAVPTTYSGSEMTPIWGLTQDGLKRTGRDERVRAASVLYDPVLSRYLPANVAVPSAFNALAHVVEALYASDADGDVLAWAEEAAREIVETLPALVRASDDLGLRERALRGACLAGACLGRATMGLHHKLCHVLGGTFGLPHAETHTALLPYVARFNLETAPAARARLGGAIGDGDPEAALFRITRSAGVTLGLGRLGLPRGALDRVVEIATAAPFPNPRAVTPEALRALLEDAYAGA